MQSMAVIAVCSMIGGVGETMLALDLAWQVCRAGRGWVKRPAAA